MNIDTSALNFTESFGDNVIIWRSRFIQSGLTAAVVAFAVAFFSQNQFAMATSALAIGVGFLGALNQRDLQSVNKFEQDLASGVRNTNACSKELSKVKSLQKKYIDATYTLHQLITKGIPGTIDHAQKTIEEAPSIKGRRIREGVVFKGESLAEVVDSLLPRVQQLAQMLRERNATIAVLEGRILGLELELATTKQELERKSGRRNLKGRK